MGHETFERHEEVQGSSNRTLGLVFGAVFLIIAVFPWFFGRGIRLWALIVCIGFVAVALVWPQLLAPLNRVWTRLGLVLHKIVSPIILGIMFFGVFTPMGFVMRLLGKDPLRLRFDRQSSSYWVERTPPGPKPDTLSDQF
jgi:hypothetical protein